jgi:hypothetical protein
MAALSCGLAVMPVGAQYAVPPATAQYLPLSAQQLDQLLGSIALYPDPLIAQILPAATLPTQIVLADRYVSGGGDPNGIDQQPWDASVQGLARYPTVLKWMDDNLNWTTELGAAFLNQQQDVMDSIQRLRGEAQNVGNLQSTPQQQVVDDSGDIEILPADPGVIYVPQYAPDSVYYQSELGTPFITFGVGFAVGGWLNGDFDWHNHHLVTWDRDHPRPGDWWHERPEQRRDVFGHQAGVWHPQNRRDVGGGDRGDRGYDNRGDNRGAGRPVVVSRPDQHPAAPRQAREPFAPQRAPTQTERPAESRPVESRPAPVMRAPRNDTFIGIQHAQDAKTFSNRGQQSRQIASPVRSSPAPASGNRGNGGPNNKH